MVITTITVLGKWLVPVVTAAERLVLICSCLRLSSAWKLLELHVCSSLEGSLASLLEFNVGKHNKQHYWDFLAGMFY